MNDSHRFPFSRLLHLSLALLVGVTPASATDHRDSAKVLETPAGDLNDLYAFVNPNDSSEVVLVMTVMPGARPDAGFAPDIRYSFLIDGARDQGARQVTHHQISCVFPSTSDITCSSIDSWVSGAVGQTLVGESFRVFSGHRDDPSYINTKGLVRSMIDDVPRNRFRETIADGQDSANIHRGENVLAIVIGIPAARIDSNGTKTWLRIWAATEKRLSSPSSFDDYAADGSLGNALIDRVGRPGISTALIDRYDDRNDYNGLGNPADWTAFAEVFDRRLRKFDQLDGIEGNALLGNSRMIGYLLVDDRLQLDTSVPDCTRYLAVEIGLPGCGGRMPEHDVVDDTLRYLISQAAPQSDFADFDELLSDEWPFLGEPN